MKNKKTLILSTLLCLLPILLGLALYEQLPEQVPVHFDFAGNPDNYAPKLVAILGLPVFMAVINLICHCAMNLEKKSMAASPAVLLAVTGWIIPILCNILMPITLFMGMGMEVPIVMIVSLIVGLVFVIIGNYLPKVKPNRYMGIKLPWTFASEENWRRTHRFGGFVWVVAGICSILAGIFRLDWLLFIALSASILLPTVYSWQLSRKHI